MNGSNKKAWFNVLIIYSDPTAGLQAFGTFDRLAHLFEREFLCENNLLSVRALSDPELAEQSAYDAGRADMVMVAIESPNDLTPEFWDWSARWPDIPRKAPRILVVVMDELSREVTNEAAMERLKHLADSHGMDYLSNLGTEMIAHRTPVLEWLVTDLMPGNAAQSKGNVIPLGVTYRQWGIND